MSMPKHMWLCNAYITVNNTQDMVGLCTSVEPDKGVSYQYTNTEHLKEKIEYLHKSYKMNGENQEYNEGYNQALNDILSILKETGCA